MSYFMGIDIGTSGSRAIIIDAAGNLKGSATAEHPCATPKPLWSEQSPDDWWNTVCQAVSQAVKASGVQPKDISSVGLSGQMHGLTLLDDKNQVLRPAILWNDQRTADECREITSLAGGEEALLEMVSNPALTGFTAPKLLWVQKNEPEIFEQVAKVLLPKDFIRFKLTGEFATEVSDASGTLLLDVQNRAWSQSLIEKMSWAPSLLPRVCESIEVSGVISESASKALNGSLLPGTPVVGGGGDQAAGAVGAGVVRAGVASVCLGTSGVVFVHADEVKTDPKGRLHTFCHAVPNKWHLMGVCLSSGASLQWFRNQLGGEEVERAKQSGGDAYDLLLDAAGREPAGAGGLCFLPYLTGERTPHADPYARGAFVGLTPASGKGAMARAIVEGVCFSLKDSMEIIKGLDIPVDEVRVLGGGARNLLWVQTLADVLGQPVCTLEVQEGPALGAALLAAVGVGTFESVEAACEACVRTGATTRPDPERLKIYRERYPIWQQLYGSLKDGFRALSDAEQSTQ